MDKLLVKAEELKKEIDSTPLFAEYARLKKLYDSDEEIQELKKQIVRAKNENRLDDHNALLEKLENNPLYQNYRKVEIETKEYLIEISDILNKK